MGLGGVTGFAMNRDPFVGAVRSALFVVNVLGLTF